MLMQRYTPDSGLGSELGHLFGNVFGNALRNGSTLAPWTPFETSRAMPASVEETNEGVTVRVELTGVDPELIDVQVAGDILTIAVENPVGSGDGSATQPHRFGTFRQSVALPAPIDPSLTSARSELGVLVVDLKKAEDSMPKRIAVTQA